MNGLDDLHLSFETGVVIPFHVSEGRLLVFVVSWPTVKVRVRVAKLHTDQTVGSSVTNASLPAVTVSGVTWTPVSSLSFGFGGHRWGGIAIDWVTQRSRFWLPRLNVQSGQLDPTPRIELGCRGTTPRKGRGYKVKNRREPLQATLDPGCGLPLLVGPLWW